jgi:hypothetical protein
MPIEWPRWRPATAVASIVIVLAGVLASWGIDREIAYYDSGAYVVTAKSLATGEGYKNLNLPGAPPQGLYPPVTPLLYALLWRLGPEFPDNVLLLKSVTLALSVAFLAVTYLWLTGAGLQPAAAAAGVALVGFHPLFLLFSTELSSEMPYAFLSLVGLLMYQAFLRTEKTSWLVIAAAAGAITALTRSFGAALLFALIADLFSRRKVLAGLVVAVVSAGALVPWTIWSWHARRAYAGYPDAVAVNYRGYLVNLISTDWLRRLAQTLPLNAASFVSSWLSWTVPWLPTIAALFIVAMTMLAVLRRRAASPGVSDWYVVTATALILLWPWPVNDRFVFVLSPFIVAYFFAGAEAAIRQSRTPRAKAAAAWVCASMVVISVSYDVYTDLIIYRDKAARAPLWVDFHRTVDWIDRHTEPSTVLAASDDPLFYLYSGRRAVRLAYTDPFALFYKPVESPSYDNPAEILVWLRRIHACYVIKEPLNGVRISSYFSSLIDSLRAASGSPLERVYSNRAFDVFRLSDCR